MSETLAVRRARLPGLWRVRVGAFVLLSVAILCAAPPCSARGSVRFSYSVDPTVVTCPSEEELRSAVSARLGYDPFRADAGQSLSASIARRGKGLVGTITLRSSGDKTVGEQELASNSDGCDELSHAMASAIAIALDPLAVSGRPVAAPSPPPTPPLATSTSVAEPPVARRPPEQPAKVTGDPHPPAFRAGVGPVVTYGALPSVAFGGVVSFGIVWPAVAVDAEAFGLLPASQSNDLGTVTAWLVGGTLVPCLSLRAFSICPTASVGVLHGTGEGVTTVHADSSLYVGLGLRLSAEIRLGERIAIVPRIDATGNLVRAQLQIDHNDVWRAPVGGVSAGATARVYFP